MLAAMVVNGENRVPSIYNRQHLHYRKKRGAKKREEEKPSEVTKMKVWVYKYLLNSDITDVFECLLCSVALHRWIASRRRMTRRSLLW
jgi:hypothetical protein